MSREGEGWGKGGGGEGAGCALTPRLRITRSLPPPRDPHQTFHLLPSTLTSKIHSPRNRTMTLHCTIAQRGHSPRGLRPSPTGRKAPNRIAGRQNPPLPKMSLWPSLLASRLPPALRPPPPRPRAPPPQQGFIFHPQGTGCPVFASSGPRCFALEDAHVRFPLDLRDINATYIPLL